MDIVREPEATATPPASGTVSGSHCEEQAVVEVEEKKQLIVADISHSTDTEASRDDHKRTSEDGQQGPRTKDESDHISKKHVRKKRYKQTRRHGE